MKNTVGINFQPFVFFLLSKYEMGTICLIERVHILFIEYITPLESTIILISKRRFFLFQFKNGILNSEIQLKLNTKLLVIKVLQNRTIYKKILIQFDS